MGKLCTACREADVGKWEAEISIEKRIVMDPLIITSMRPPRKKVMYMTGESHLNKWGMY
jgi:hypothetical protein